MFPDNLLAPNTEFAALLTLVEGVRMQLYNTLLQAHHEHTHCVAWVDTMPLMTNQGDLVPMVEASDLRHSRSRLASCPWRPNPSCTWLLAPAQGS